MQYAVHALLKLTKRSIIWHKTQEEPSRVLTTFGIHLERSPSKCNKRKIQPKTWNTAKKTRFNYWSKCTHQNTDVKKKLQTASFIFVWNAFEHQVKDRYASHEFRGFFLVFASQKHISVWDMLLATSERVHQGAPLKSFEHTYCSIRSRISKDTVNKAEKTNSLVPQSNQRVSKKGWKTQKDSK